ncbi:MAG: hypothetical protein LUG23_08905, partial [Oscillospiraceae bacterium]|nr:hypothetical protein [Oscillospiraceae bacterium]
MLKRVLCVLTSIALVLAMMPSVVATSSSSTSTGSSTTSSWVAYIDNGTTSEGYYSYTFSWSEVSDASYYIVTINGESYIATSTSYTVSTLENGKTYIVYVTAYDSDDSSTGTVGMATFTVGTSSSSSSSSSSSTSTSTTGTNCTVTSYASTKTVTWNAYDGAEYYVVTYFVGTSSTGTSLTTASTSISLPIPNTSDVTIYVVAYDLQGIALGMIATANVEASSSSSSTTTGISCSFVGINSDMSYNYVFSWNMYSSETEGYHIYINGAYADSTTSTSYSTTFPSGSYYTVGVYAFDSSGNILGTVGQVSFSIAGSSSSSTTAEDNCTLIGITSDGLDRYLISWNEYDGAVYYQVVAYVPNSEGSATYTQYATSGYTANLEITMDIEDGQDYLFYVYAYDPSYYRLGVADYCKVTATSSTTVDEATYTISIPSSALFSSAEAGDYMEITLPTNLSNPVSESDISPSVTDLSVSYTLTMADVSIKLQPSDGYEAIYDIYTQTIEMGVFARDYAVVDDVTFSPMFPVSVLSSNTDIITITATVDISGYSNDPTMSVEELYTVYGSPITVKYYNSEGTLTGSMWYFSNLSTSKSTSLHSITSSSVENGTLTTDLVSAASGLTVTVEASAESGYELSGVTVTDADGANVAVTDCGDGTYTFTMPSSAVTVSADVSHAHSLTKTDAVAETCLTDGNIEYWYCSVCGNYYSDEDCTTEVALEDTIVEAIGHNYEAVITESTCTEDGYTTYTCSNCGDSYVADETEATGHSYESVVTEPTCTEGGYTTHTCSNCGDTYTDSETEALGHNYESEVTTEATCTEAGVRTYTCTRCGDTYTEEIPATGHNYVPTETTATCTEGGYTTYVCSECGDTYTDEETEALGHDYESVVTKEPTCTETGIMTYTCSRCGDTYTEDIDIVDHTYGEPEWTWVWSETEQTYNVTAKFTCEVCGGTDTETALVTSV